MSKTDFIKQNIVNALGWKTKKRLIVFQSDDWGTIRMPNKEVYDILLNNNVGLNDPYDKYDCIESTFDLKQLFEVLQSVKDFKGNPAVFTANCLAANPDFEKILQSNYGKYFYRPIDKNLVDRWIEGKNLNVFFPQFHGREHLNTSLWMDALKKGEKNVCLAFNNKCFGITTNTPSNKRKHFLAAFDFDDESEIEFHEHVIEEGLTLFKEYFGFDSQSFIAPNYVWSDKLNAKLIKCGIKYIQTQRNQLEPKSEGYKAVFRYTGQQSSEGLTYINRNCLFEPSADSKKNWVESCLKDIENAFFWNTPAVISTHRVNYMSGIDMSNGAKGIEMLSKLLKKILINWPDAEFINTVELGDLINKKNRK